MKPVLFEACVALASIACASRSAAPAEVSTTSARIAVVRAEGAPRERVERLFGPAAEPMHRCLHGKTGAITLRVTSKNGVLDVSAAPGFTLDESMRTCAMNALTPVWSEETASNAGGPSIPPTGFSSIVTVQW